MSPGFPLTVAGKHAVAQLRGESHERPELVPSRVAFGFGSSKEDFDRFLQEKLLPSMPVEGGFSGQPEQRTAEVANLLTA
jgi:hypothetical protein